MTECLYGIICSKWILTSELLKHIPTVQGSLVFSSHIATCSRYDSTQHSRRGDVAVRPALSHTWKAAVSWLHIQALKETGANSSQCKTNSSIVLDNLTFTVEQ